MGQRISSLKGSGRSGILRNDIAQSSELQRVYPLLAAALQNGSSTRPGLPIELVSYIMRLADCVLLSMLTKVSTESFVLHSSSSQLHAQPCLLSDTVSQKMIPHLAKLRLTTSSHDQGWCSEPSRGSWTWFEITLVERDAAGNLRVKMVPVRSNTEAGRKSSRVPRSASPSFPQHAPQIQQKEITTSSSSPTENNIPLRPLSWISHRNQVCSSDFIVHEGIEFGPDHEIWQHISGGDRILVRACAQYGGWRNHVDWTTLRLWEWYNPMS